MEMVLTLKMLLTKAAIAEHKPFLHSVTTPLSRSDCATLIKNELFKIRLTEKL